MPAVSGRRGGPRPGAGRPKKPPQTLDSQTRASDDPKEFLATVMKDPALDVKVRLEAAKILMPYVHEKIAQPVGKKAAAQRKAMSAEHGTGWSELLQ